MTSIIIKLPKASDEDNYSKAARENKTLHYVIKK